MRGIVTGLWMVIAVLVGSTLGPSAADAQKKTLVVALNQDPDILDPTLSRTYVGRIIYAQMCE
jgi:peptide/nickel transport system substrate-binding protein